jgi:hypothetical protein
MSLNTFVAVLVGFGLFIAAIAESPAEDRGAPAGV